jgi:hypothetical protein
MKFIYILIEKTELNNINGFYDRKVMMQHEAQNLNEDLDRLIWVLQPNY